MAKLFVYATRKFVITVSFELKFYKRITIGHFKQTLTCRQHQQLNYEDNNLPKY